MSFRVLTAEFSHESNTFSQRPTDLAAFRDRYYFVGADAIPERGTANTPLAGFLKIARAENWTVHHAISAGATPSGPVTREAYEHVAAAIVNTAKMLRGTLDGILLGLHGAMVAAHVEDGEGELLERLRSIVGPDLPIGITLDPHANVTERMVRLATAIVSYKTYPHVDMRESGEQAARIIGRTMAGEIRPVTLWEKLPMLEEATGGRTDIGPMVPRIALARAYEEKPDVFAVSVNGAFPNADIADVGPSVLVTCQGDLPKHQAFIRGLAADIWEMRADRGEPLLTVAAAAEYATRFEDSNGPLVIADFADNPGGGAYGDSTALLAALIAADVQDACFAPIFDPESVALLSKHQPGDTVRLKLGGKTDAHFGGGPLDLSATLIGLFDGHYIGHGPMLDGLRGSFGPCATIRIGGIEVLVVSNVTQVLDLAQFQAFGIEPTERRVVALKSMQHFRAAFEPVAGEVIVCDSGALCTPDLTKMPYSRARRPIYPLEADAAWV